MKRMLVLAVAGMFVSVTAVLTAVGADDKTPTVKAIMKKLHTPKTGELAKVKAQLKKAQPNWTALAKEAKEYEAFTANLAKNEPPHGEKADWDKLATEFHDHAKALEEAVKDKDKSAAEAAVKKMTASCKNCHDAHKSQ
jgi:cytochrome c556